MSLNENLDKNYYDMYTEAHSAPVGMSFKSTRL